MFESSAHKTYEFCIYFASNMLSSEPGNLGIINPQNRQTKRHYKSLKWAKKGNKKTCIMSTFSIQKLHNPLFLLSILMY